MLGAGEAAGALDAGDVCCAGCGVGVAVAVGVLEPVVSKTDRDPVSDGSASINAINMNAAAAPIVIFANKLAVPRGPNAVLESELENKAPASALPGWSRITTIRTTHDRTNNPYKM